MPDRADTSYNNLSISYYQPSCKENPMIVGWKYGFIGELHGNASRKNIEKKTQL
jgi:hypothetical protein